MQHQYWVTKKSVMRKLGSKEDECIVSSDAELDAKLELFRSIADSCVQLQKVIDMYQERLCFLAQEENALGRYLKECGKNEKNANAGQIMTTTGKALAYIGHQRLTIRSPLVRLHHEVETFKARAVTDTRSTVAEMEKARTEYRAALSWMKSASSQLDPDTGHGLERFRKAQSYVKSTKARFDRLMLACLQKVDLLAAARCNMFSHALVSYQNTLNAFSTKAAETLALATSKLNTVDSQPYEFSCLADVLSQSQQNVDKDKKTFFNAEYTDEKPKKITKKEKKEKAKEKDSGDSTSASVANLLGEDFEISNDERPTTEEVTTNNSSLLDLNWSTNADFFGGEFMPSRFIQEGNINLDNKIKDIAKGEGDVKEIKESKKDNEKIDAKVSWLSLFAELDPLSNQNNQNSNSGDMA